MKKFTNYKYM